MICERCGNEIADNAAICLSCGTLTSTAQPAEHFPTQDETNSSGTYDEPTSSYEQGYRNNASRQDYKRPPQSDHKTSSQSNYQYGASYTSPPFQPGGINVNVYNNYVPAQKNNSALIVEIILSLFGIYGVGWLIGGQTAVGVVLLICSIVFYIPLAILGIIFTLGLGIFCVGPLSIAA